MNFFILISKRHLISSAWSYFLTIGLMHKGLLSTVSDVTCGGRGGNIDKEVVNVWQSLSSVANEYPPPPSHGNCHFLLRFVVSEKSRHGGKKCLTFLYRSYTTGISLFILNTRPLASFHTDRTKSAILLANLLICALKLCGSCKRRRAYCFLNVFLAQLFALSCAHEHDISLG